MNLFKLFKKKHPEAIPEESPKISIRIFDVDNQKYLFGGMCLDSEEVAKAMASDWLNIRASYYNENSRIELHKTPSV